MSETTPDYGDPSEWDWIPDTWYEAFEAAVTALGYTITDAHDTAISIEVPGLDEGEEWAIVSPGFHGMWAYGVYTNGYCANPIWIYVDAADPQAIADAVHAILSGAPLESFYLAGGTAVYPKDGGAP